MRDKYLKFIAHLSKKYSRSFGNVWWYSLLHEKNSAGKSRAYHNLCKGIEPKHFNIWIAFCLGIKKLLVLFIRHFIFRKGYKKHTGQENIFISYSQEFLYPFNDSDGLWILLPQMNKWREDRGKLVVDNFISLNDLFRLFGKYLSLLPWHLYYVSKLKKEFAETVCHSNSIFAYSYFKEEILRSFFGDVLVEGLFYEIAFKNIRNRYKNPETKKIVYPYEGQHWEKALCIAFTYSQIELISILCTPPVTGMLNYWYDREEADLMPKPDRIGVLGSVTYYWFKKMYGDRVFIAGPMRFRYIENLLIEEIKEVKESYKYLFVILPSVKEYADELLDFVTKINHDYIVVKPHPDYMGIKLHKKYSVYYGEDIEYYLRRSIAVISIDSSVSFMAATMGVPVIVPELKSIVSLNPLNDFGGEVIPIDDSYAFDAALRDLSNGTYENLKEVNKDFVRKYFRFDKNEREEVL